MSRYPSFATLLCGVLLWPICFLWASMAFAAPDGVCLQYAQDAVNAQQQNLSNQCGLAGDPWSLNFNDHRSWCLGAPQSSVDRETNARHNALSQCLKCVAFAQQAVNAQQQNLSNQCGLAGDRWSSNFNGHRSWCMGAPQSKIDGETNARNGDLAKCSSCIAYAQEAINAQQQNMDNRCGLAGDLWSSNFNNHRLWCMGVSQERADVDTNARRGALAQCPTCVAYARDAVIAQKQNLNNQCGLTGDLWSLNYSGHLSWCIGASHDSSSGETNLRKSLLTSCLAPGKKAACASYASNAIHQFGIAKQRNCDISGDQKRWHDNYQDHYGWCMAVNPRDPDNPNRETAARDSKLAECAKGVQPYGSHGPTGSEQCLMSVTIWNRECLNATDGSPSTTYPPHTSSTFGCGGNEQQALARAKISFALIDYGLIDGDTPKAGYCTYEKDVVQGCLCR